jgi:sec-independent protein translocase protein TatA
MFGNIGATELIIVLVIVLVLFGARRVPEIGASIGKGIREFKRNISDTERQIRDSAAIDEPRAADRLSTGAMDQPPREEVRPEPKRLIN